MRIRLTKNQWERISELLGNLGIVAFVAFVVPYIIGQIDLLRATSGLVISLGMWYISIIVARRY